VPFARVVAVSPRGQRGERLDLDLILPPRGSDGQAVSLAQGAYVDPKLLEPHPPLPRVELSPAERPACAARIVAHGSASARSRRSRPACVARSYARSTTSDNRATNSGRSIFEAFASPIR